MVEFEDQLCTTVDSILELLGVEPTVGRQIVSCDTQPKCQRPNTLPALPSTILHPATPHQYANIPTSSTVPLMPRSNVSSGSTKRPLATLGSSTSTGARLIKTHSELERVLDEMG